MLWQTAAPSYVTRMQSSLSRRPWIIASVMAGTFMIAVEATIVSTAMPKIAGQLGDLHLYAWVFSAYLLTQTAMTVVFGKLADTYGRKPVLLVGIGIFLVGSLLCGMAWSIPSLIGFRLLQGVGAGAIQPVCMTVVGDLYPVQERGKVQGWLASVWGLSSVLGPLAGGLIIQHLSWAWIFWINLPVGLLAMAGFAAFLREQVSAEHARVDVPGAALFTLAMASLMLGLTQIGTGQLGSTLAAFAVFAAATALFVWQERRAANPIVAFRLWSFRPIATANAATLLSGMVVIGLTAFLPMYVQGVLDQSPLVAGFTLTVMVLGWPVGATLGARSFNRFGLRAILLCGGALLPVGGIVFVLLRPGSSPLLGGLGSLVTGLGMGLLSTAAIMVVQSSVGWAERGAATASNIFARSLGSTLGATVLGAVLNNSLAAGGSRAVVSPDQLRQLLDRPETLAGMAAVRSALGESLHVTFWAVFILAALTFVLSTLVPRLPLAGAATERAIAG